MKSKIVVVFTLVLCMVYSSVVEAQPHKKVVVVHKGKKHHAKAGTKKVIVVRKSKFRPVKVVVFHPHWGPNKSFHRRWVYFPKYNCYWDNWRNVYFYKTTHGWVSTAQKPTIIINVNLENENHYELNEVHDDNDEVYKEGI